MKVLFAVNNENISESIIQKYQQEYKEIISVKNVYYFNAIIKELQRDKSYDRIVISEDLQPFSNNNYDAIDKFIFEQMDKISDEAADQLGSDIPIILICTDRRTKSEPLLVKLFGIGVYNALLGKDRSITKVCELLARPRTKKEAKVYYNIDSEDVDYKVENEGDVSEIEIQNIISHYKKLGNNEQKYVESFDHIASQYTDSQLRLIANFLPLNVKAVLEANSPKYQSVVSFANQPRVNSEKNKKFNDYSKNAKNKYNTKKEEPKIDLIEKNLNKSKMTEPVVIPSTINTANVKKTQETVRKQQQPIRQQEKPQLRQIQEIDDILGELPTMQEVAPKMNENVPPVQNENMQQAQNLNKPVPTKEQEPEVAVQPKRRGRPKKVQTEPIEQEKMQAPKKGRGRPKKVVEQTAPQEEPTMQIQNEVPNTAPLNLFELGEEEEQNPIIPPQADGIILPGFDDETLFEEELASNNRQEEQPQEIVPQAPVNNFESEPINTNTQIQSNSGNIWGQEQQPTIEPTNTFSRNTQNAIENTNNYQASANLSGLLTRDKKVVAFVGTSKNGTSFLVNNVAEMLSQKGINTAILDLTQNKNAYYIYTENEENLRQVSYNCIDNLRRGNAQGIQVHKNLTVYTMLPGENEDINDYEHILETLVQNYSLVILDCDFDTNYGYFKEAQELYLVQSLDVLTIQPLTAFLRNLKAKNVLDPEKIRVVLNKVVKLRSVTDKTIIGGMAYYNDPAMSFMTELFNKDTVTYCSIPFEEQAYSKYLEGLVNCKITLNGYSKNFMAVLSKLADMVYPLINGSNNKGNTANYNNYHNPNYFSNSMNNTLDKMKNNY